MVRTEARSSFQQHAGQIGAAFTKMCDLALEQQGWVLGGPDHIPTIGIQIDQIANNRKGISFFFEYKGSTNGTRPGLIRTDSTKKALCNAFLMREEQFGPFVIITSHMPEPGSDSDIMLRVALEVGAVRDTICLYNTSDMKRLAGYLNWEYDLAPRKVRT